LGKQEERQGMIEYKDMFSRLIEAFSVAAHRKCEYLDLVNFNRQIYREVIDPRYVEEIFNPTHGYACPDGSFELGKLIKLLEWSRERTYRNWLKGAYPRLATEILRHEVAYDTLSVGTGVGTTGVMTCLIRAVYDLQQKNDTPDILLCTPNYPVYDAIIRASRANSKYLRCLAENQFLPTLRQVEENISPNTIAFILTFPNNPAQTTYGPEKLHELQAIVDLCRENRIFLITDNVYQDTIWNSDNLNPELLSLIDDSSFVAKVYGPSKDRPFYSGRRMGYYIGDNRLEKAYFYYASIFTNTHNSHSSCMFALDLLFRRKMLDGSAPTLDDCRTLDTFLSGWNINIDPAFMFDEIKRRKMYEVYNQNVRYNNAEMRSSLLAIKRYLFELPIIEKVVNGDIGNVIFAKVNSDIFKGNCQDFFIRALEDAQLGILPGNVFGMPEENGNAWFRITTIHDTVDVINHRLKHLSDVFCHNN
jgi:aspartate/methionine/tyrosine aminotransferase